VFAVLLKSLFYRKHVASGPSMSSVSHMLINKRQHMTVRQPGFNVLFLCHYYTTCFRQL